MEDYERLQKIGMLNRDVKDFDQLIGGEIEFVVSRGNIIHVKLDNKVNLILGPEYDGKIFIHHKEEMYLKKFHLKLDFCDDIILTVRLTSMV